MQSDPRADLAHTLHNRAQDPATLNVVAGFDGFVDQLAQIVEQRQDLERFTPVPTISRFAEILGQAAGRTSLREFVVRGEFPGGCAVNLGSGIAALGANLDYFGTLGAPPHPAFAEFAKSCRSCTSWGREPGFTMAMEFQDGKYMLSKVEQLGNFNEELVEQNLADGHFNAACVDASLIALTNWTLYPHMTACWELLQRQVFANLEHRPWFFIDLVDPRSRSQNDIREMLSILSGFEEFGPCILGGNLNEANVIASMLGIDEVHKEGEAVVEQAEAIRKALNISEAAIHCFAGAAVAARDGSAWVEGPYTPSPKQNTHAGDHFNAGYCLARMMNLSPEQRCILGTAASGFFVRKARSGSLKEVTHLLESWAEGSLPD